MLQVFYVLNVSTIFKRMLQVFYLDIYDVAYVGLAIHHMLWLYVSNVSAIFKRVLQVFYLDIAYVAMAIHICCKCMFQMFRLFSNVCCKYFI
jgi:hypothetical protein